MIPRLPFNILPLVACLLVAFCSPSNSADWQPANSRLTTTWGEQVTPSNAWQEYPRPALERKAWTNLNGLWEWSVTPKDAAEPGAWSGKILVPYAIEAPLSGVGRLLEPNEALWYRRTLQLAPKAGQHILLNFEAVDYQCTVSVNGTQVGTHTGGSTPFSFDITAVAKPGENTVLVRVLDATQEWQLSGKQRLRPEGIWYTRVSGIWQTVWLEETPARYLSRVDTVWNPAASTLTVTPTLSGDKTPGDTVQVTASFGGAKIASATGTGALQLNLPNPQLWSPSHPNLYDLSVELLDAAGKPIDTATSYAGLRTVGKMRDAEGNMRFTLNGKAIFHWGPLDQGWWPDGLLTPPSDAGMRSDIEFLKSAGFNMIRKHIKVEPRRYYYYCDKLGMMVWQDQVSGGKDPKWVHEQPNPEDAEWPDAAHAQWVTEYQRMVDLLRDEPCIVVWDPFNERWGQHRTLEIGKMAVAYDPTRLVNIASGGNWWPVGDIADAHAYPNPGFPLWDARFKDYVKVVGEFGGHGFPVAGHLWNSQAKNWGYGGLPKNKEEWIERYTKSIQILADLKCKGISGGVYTQTSDVESELNGLLTYDRKVQKLDPKVLAEIHKALGDLEAP